MIIKELKSILDSIKILLNEKVDKKDIVQPDWSQNDETALDYVKNRTHYEYVTENLIPITTKGQAEALKRALYNDGSARFVVNGNEYTEFITSYYGSQEQRLTTVDGSYIIRYGAYLPSSSHVSFEPSDAVWYVYEPATAVQKLDEKYVPDSIARTDNVVPVPESTEVGQTLVVKTIDENGRPTGWETVETQSDWNQNDTSAPDFIKNKPDVVLRSEIEEVDAIELVTELALVSPAAAEDGSIYTDENGALYSL